ncbi:hypothetical protein THAOC_21635 [Thalassiosira oceanica]|uniref:DDE Tnp4 domain-containing protein n=1 Tax=Thalassiosira oceanica TaxID=159749 RepID=K0SID8_THAOC|nr:hypothetical protein THAOC_21635 [Thalassiosira oceanica]|eukprot:EJK58257.1 hypothetical protein THAOC_21635 [Thalassiosira oceanica]
MTRHRNSPAAKANARVHKRAKTVMQAMLSMKCLTDIVSLQDLDESALDEALLGYMEKLRVSSEHRARAAKRIFRQRKRWSDFSAKLTDRQFRRYFRMSRECFYLLCRRIEENVGEKAFKSEVFLDNLKYTRDPNLVRMSKLMRAHENTTGGFISGEIKLALTLRLLAGGSYLDLSLLFECGSSTAYEIFHKVIREWICSKDKPLVNINGKDFIDDEERMAAVALEFARSSAGLFSGCIGAIDGWVVKIKKPSQGFYGLNVVVICDRKKRILYRVINSRGAEHDSTAFKNSSLYRKLMDDCDRLLEKGFHFIGDSAYAIRSFLLTPFDNAVHGTPEDNFNFFHSSSRICIECTFGEVDLRWGILWSPLKFSLRNNIKVIDACLMLHNFIVDHRESLGENVSSMERDVFDDDCRRFMASQTGIYSVGVHGGDGGATAQRREELC